MTPSQIHGMDRSSCCTFRFVWSPTCRCLSMSVRMGPYLCCVCVRKFRYDHNRLHMPNFKVSSHDSANPTQTMKMARAGFIIGLTAPDEGRRNVVLRARRSVWSGHLYEHQTVAPAVGARRADCSFYRCPPGLVARRTDDGGHLQVCGWAGCASEDGRRLRPLA